MEFSPFFLGGAKPKPVEVQSPPAKCVALIRAPVLVPIVCESFDRMLDHFPDVNEFHAGVESGVKAF